ncbi:DnaB-like helicase C-terminal domain-containing protein [Polycladidibacter hongkongensis]|uniref:DnaB-like helicase C-terminal domain-containing protein n=1 Tax=Polycladidibacter hongkongensis TaxID=1647556 RepID=UPI00083189F7|nr:DnaB-like helicase C-terminal domain-containing protein [Pseudovibrio hongkongensis]
MNLSAVEQQVLSVALCNPGRFYEAAELIGADHLAEPMWRAVWQGLQASAASGAFDLPLVEANSPYEGQEDLLGRMFALAAAGGSIQTPVIELVQPLIERRNSQLISETLQKGLAMLGKQTDSRATAEALIDELQSIAAEASKARPVRLGELANDAFARANAPDQERGAVLSTGIAALDKLLGGGLAAGELTVLGAEGAAGKTALSLQLGLHIAGAFGAVDFQSMEMTGQQVVERWLAGQTGVSSSHIRQGGLGAEALEKLYLAGQGAQELPFYVTSTKTSIEELFNRGKANKSRYGTKLMIVDSIKATQVKDTRLNADIARRCGHVVSELKELAKELDLPVLAIGHAVRSDNPPLQRLTRRGLYGGSNMEDAPDNVLILHRPEPILERNRPEDGSEDYMRWLSDCATWKGRAQIHADKVRMGKSGEKIELFFDGPTTTFKEDRSHEEGMMF